MTVRYQEHCAGKVLYVEATDKLEAKDYEEFVPLLEQRIREHGKLRILFTMSDFHGWKLSALWEDIKLDVRHFAHIERIAMVGDKTWQKWMATFCKPFTTAEVRFFESQEAGEAEAWICEGLREGVSEETAQR